MNEPDLSTQSPVTEPAPSPVARSAPAQLPWYKSGVIYQVHVRSYHDASGDGIGDFRGLTAKLDYIQDLGVTAIWLLPFYPSPLRDDGYDIADYTSVNRAYGSMLDVRVFIREAHRRGLKVVTELVLNHTSDQHPWFQRARRAPAGSKYRNFYVWSDTPERYAGTRIIFQDFESSNWTWDPVAEAYYWHRFYAHQPDLNFDNPAVHDALRRAVDHWFEAGVDGLRLDAVPYLYERDGTTCENLPETHAYLRQLRAHLDRKHPGAMLLAEANQWPEDAAAYFGEGDECHMAFHFPLMPRLFMAVQMEDRFPIVDILHQTPAIPDVCQWAVFLRNHDELTLEMVTDEERDYMYRVYAGDRQARINLGIRRRLAPLLENNRAKIELMNGLLFSMPGTPIVYYGDEIGMGDNFYLGDRNAVRTPMQWSADRNAGFSRANPQRLFLPVVIDPEYHYEAVNVEAQQNNPTSLLWWMKRLIALRRRYDVFGAGAITFVNVNNPSVLGFIRRSETQQVLVVANLSRFPQPAELDLAEWRGLTPVEMFGHIEFPPIGDLPYFITLGPYSFYWFSLERTPSTIVVSREHPEAPPETAEPPTISIRGAPKDWLASEAGRGRIEQLLAEDLPRRRWFRSKSRPVRQLRVLDQIAVDTGAPEQELAIFVHLVEFEYYQGDPETYVVPLAVAGPSHTAYLFGAESPAIVARVQSRDDETPWVLYDAVVDPAFARAALDMMVRRRRARGLAGRIEGSSSRTGRQLAAGGAELGVQVPRAEQTNSSVLFEDRLIMKVFRVVAPGVNPDVEITRHLTERRGFEHTPAFAGTVEYAGGGEPATLALLQKFVPNEGDGWRHTLGALGGYYEAVLTREPVGEGERPDEPVVPEAPLVTLARQEPPALAGAMFGHELDAAGLLGRRTAQMHAALADPQVEAFRPEPFTPILQRSLYQSLRNSAEHSFRLLQSRRQDLPEEIRVQADAVLNREDETLQRMAAVTQRPLHGMRIRIHGDYHLGQTLWTGCDFVIIDFEGEPARALSERRLKWTPLRDVAGMIRSFHYAAHVALGEEVERGRVASSPEALAPLEPWVRFWQAWVSATYLQSYLTALRESRAELLPADDDGVRTLLESWILEKALYEVRYELNSRPSWVGIPLSGVLEVLDATTS